MEMIIEVHIHKSYCFLPFAEPVIGLYTYKPAVPSKSEPIQADINGDEMVSFEEFHDIFFEGQ